jgi:hypothetical protein
VLRQTGPLFSDIRKSVIPNGVCEVRNPSLSWHLTEEFLATPGTTVKYPFSTSQAYD